MIADTEAIPIYESQDFYVPSFEVRLGGRTAPADIVRDITQVSYKDSLGSIDSFELTMNNWDAENRTFRWVDEQTFDPGQELELWMGYYGQGDQRRMIRGEITSLRPNFPSGGQPTLSVTGLNVLHRFRTEQTSWAYIEQTDTQIAKQIGKRLDVDVEADPRKVPPEPTYAYLLQANQYDIVFLMERAQRIGYDLYVVEGDKPRLHFGPSDKIKRSTYELIYGRSLIQFQPTLTTANQVGEVTVRGWDAVNKKKIEATAKRSELDIKEFGGAGRSIESSFNQKKEVIADRPIADEAEAKQLAKETLENIAKDMIKASGSTLGLPDLRSGGALEISGLGDRFTGRYFITSTTHTIGGSGYTTQFQCRKEDL